MHARQEHTKVLIIGQDSQGLDTARVLLTSMGCQCRIVPNVREAVGLLAVETPNVAVLDADAVDLSSTPPGLIARQLCSKMHGRVVILADEPIIPELVDLIRRYSLSRVRRANLFHELWPEVESLLYPGPVFMQIKRVASLIWDSFLQPLSADVRGSTPVGRRLLYRSGSLVADLWLKAHSGSSRTTLIGQITDSAGPKLHLDGLSVVLQGQPGTISSATMNDVGEFQMDVDYPSNSTLEIEIGARRCLSITLPAS